MTIRFPFVATPPPISHFQPSWVLTAFIGVSTDCYRCLVLLAPSTLAATAVCLSVTPSISAGFPGFDVLTRVTIHYGIALRVSVGYTTIHPVR